MQTLEQRVRRLERSCRLWRTVCLLAALALAGIAADKPASPPDAAFAHLTVQSLTIRTRPGGAVLLASCDNDRAALRLAAPGAATTIGLTADKTAAAAILSCTTPKGFPGATLRVDNQSGTIGVQDADGKTKDIEPE